MKDIIVVGRFPPPLDGQAVATERLASLLDPHCAVQRINISAPDNLVISNAGLKPGRVVHAIRNFRSLYKQVRTRPDLPVLWPAISPTLQGHARDVLSIAPVFSKDQPVFGVVHRGDFSDLFERRHTRASGQRLIRKLSGVVFLSNTLAERSAEWIPEEKRIVIPNTILDDLICSDDEIATKQSDRKNRNDFRLLFLSNMIASKGYDDVLEAVRILRQCSFPVVARFAGHWPDDSSRNSFLRKRSDYGLEEHVEVLGAVRDRDKLKALHLWADAFVLPTYYAVEAQPLTIIEAMNAGTPVITTRHSGIPEMLGEGEGIFVPPKSPEAIADAVESLNDAATWHSKSNAARQQFLEMFSPEVVAKQWLELLSMVS